jgi:PAS domain S-box-containing protein
MAPDDKTKARLYRHLVESSPDIIYTLDPDGCFTFVGGASEELLGFKAEELLRQHFTSLIHPEDREKAQWHFNDRRTGKRATKGLEIRLMTKEGKEKPFDIKDLAVELNAFGMYEEADHTGAEGFLGTYGVARDITEQKRIQEALEKTCLELRETRDMLIRSEKLAAAGRLTAGIAHQILNPVNIISMRFQLLKRKANLPQDTVEVLAVCENQLNRITEIINDLRHLSKAHKMQVAPCDVNEIIENVIRLAAPYLEERAIRAQTRYGPDLPPVPLDKNRMEHVFLNIISNAADAMAEQKTRILSVTTKHTPSDHHVQIIISDTGTGIDEADMVKIFDPYFTTKKTGEHLGLGLFVAYNIINLHGGKIWVETDDGGGSSFFVELPRTGQDVPQTS